MLSFFLAGALALAADSQAADVTLAGVTQTVDGGGALTFKNWVDADVHVVQLVFTQMSSPLFGVSPEVGGCEEVSKQWANPPRRLMDFQGRVKAREFAADGMKADGAHNVRVLRWARTSTDKGNEASFSAAAGDLLPGTGYCVTRIDWKIGDSGAVVAAANLGEAVTDLVVVKGALDKKAAAQAAAANDWSTQSALLDAARDEKLSARADAALARWYPGQPGEETSKLQDALSSELHDHVDALSNHQRIQSALGTFDELANSDSLLGHRSVPITQDDHGAYFLAVAEALALAGHLRRVEGDPATFTVGVKPDKGDVEFKGVKELAMVRKGDTGAWGTVLVVLADDSEVELEVDLSAVPVHGTELSLLDVHGLFSGQLVLGGTLRGLTKADRDAYAFGTSPDTSDAAKASRASLEATLGRWERAMEKGRKVLKDDPSPSGHFAALGQLALWMRDGQVLTPCDQLPKGWNGVLLDEMTGSTCGEAHQDVGIWPGSRGDNHNPLVGLHAMVKRYNKEAARWGKALEEFGAPADYAKAIVVGSFGLDVAVTTTNGITSYATATIGYAHLWPGSGEQSFGLPMMGLRLYARPNPSNGRMWTWGDQDWLRLVALEVLIRAPSIKFGSSDNPVESSDVSAFGPDDRYQGPPLFIGGALHMPGVPWISASGGMGRLKRTYTGLGMEQAQPIWVPYASVAVDFALFDSLYKLARKGQ